MDKKKHKPEMEFDYSTIPKFIRKYTDITEITGEIIRNFVERIDVYKPEKVPGTRTKRQTICIHWNFIGAVYIPTE